jgi:hypothetical protein
MSLAKRKQRARLAAIQEKDGIEDVGFEEELVNETLVDEEKIEEEQVPEEPKRIIRKKKTVQSGD